ncbi:GAF domain-containing protein [Desertibaculum subflavum]|uniref:GAF domain-containing protein n=1 Tax=Desertibaculum subflavum TaxID=2268458 RepID=UPI000E66CF78
MTVEPAALIDLALSRGLDVAQTEALAAGLGSGDAALAAKAAATLRQLSQLAQVVNTLSGTLSLDRMLPRMIRLIGELLDAERASLFLHDPETDELFSRVLSGDGVTEIRMPAGSGIAGAVFRKGEAVIVPDAYADQRFNPEVDRQSGFRTRDILCVPMRDPTARVIGVAQALNHRGTRFSDADRNLLEAISAQAAAALEHARLYETLERARSEQARLLEISEAISSDLQIDTLLGRIVEATNDLLDAERATLFLYDPETRELWSKVATGAGAELAEIRIASDAGIAGVAFTSGKPQNIADAYADPRFNAEVDRRSGFRTRNLLCLPVDDRYGGAVGVLQVLNKRGGPFTQHDIRLLRTFSSQIAISIANARLFADVLELKNYNESVLKSLTNGVVTLDRERRVVKMNEAAERLLGIAEGQAEQMAVADLFAETNPWILRSLDYVGRTGGSDYHADTELKLPESAAASVNLTVAPLKDLKGQTIGYMLVFEDITREKRVRSTMSRYMAKEVVDKILEGGREVMEGSSQLATVLFSDIRRFTSLVERMTARETVTMLNEYFGEMVEIVFRHGGILDKYIGDAIMATFGAPIVSGSDADNALRVANGMMTALRGLNQRRAAKGLEAIEIGIGLATGPVLAGSIGSEKRMEYTVIGDSVNLAARLESANKHYGTHVLVAGETIDHVEWPHRFRELDLIRVKGRQRPGSIFEALDHHTEESFPNGETVLACFKEGLALYRSRLWMPARQAFQAALAANPEDGPSKVYIDRCVYYAEQPPGDDWDGVWTLTEK